MQRTQFGDWIIQRPDDDLTEMSLVGTYPLILAPAHHHRGDGYAVDIVDTTEDKVHASSDGFFPTAQAARSWLQKYYPDEMIEE